MFDSLSYQENNFIISFYFLILIKMSQKGVVILLFVCTLVIISLTKSFKMEAKFDFSHRTLFIGKPAKRCIISLDHWSNYFARPLCGDIEGLIPDGLTLIIISQLWNSHSRFAKRCIISLLNFNTYSMLVHCVGTLRASLE